jgi:hypothetical protein
VATRRERRRHAEAKRRRKGGGRGSRSGFGLIWDFFGTGEDRVK